MMNWYVGITQCCNISLVISPSSVTGSGGKVNPSSICSSDMLSNWQGERPQLDKTFISGNRDWSTTVKQDQLNQNNNQMRW